MNRSVPTYDLYGEQRSERPDFWLHCETIAARSSVHRWEIDLHRHEGFQQFLYIRKGFGDAMLDGATVALVPPCVATLPPGSRHGFRFSPDVDGLVVTLFADRLMPRVGLKSKYRPGDWLSVPQVIALRGSPDAGYLEDTFSRLLQEFEARRPGSDDLMRAYLHAAVLLLRRVAMAVDDTGKRPQELTIAGLLDDLIGQHFRRQLTAKAYAALLHMSPTHLNRVVRKATGMTVHDRVMQRVVEEARQALVFTSSSVQDVAAGLGFLDAAYFSRWFRQRTGRTPSRYRLQERQRLRDAEAADQLLTVKTVS